MKSYHLTNIDDENVQIPVDLEEYPVDGSGNVELKIVALAALEQLGWFLVED